MAKIKPDATGAMLNKAGGFVYYVRNGVNYVRTLSKGEYRSNTPAQELQRAKFGTLSSLSQWFSEVAKVGLKPPKGQTVANAWYSLNKDACLEDGVSVAVDFEALQFSKGVLFPPSVSMSIDGETKTVSVNLQAQPDESNCKTDDKVYAIVVDKENLFSRIEELGARGSEQSVHISLSDLWSTDVEGYAFATDSAGKKASKTVHVTMGGSV